MPESKGELRFPVGRTLYSHAVLVDTGAFLALANIKDKNHKDAVECLKKIAEYRLPLFVPLPIIYESHRRFLFDLGQLAAKRFLDSIYDGSLNIVRTIEEDEKQARILLEGYEDLKLTLTDAASMALMLRLGIAASFSFDRHFLQAGFIRIPPFHLQ